MSQTALIPCHSPERLWRNESPARGLQFAKGSDSWSKSPFEGENPPRHMSQRLSFSIPRQERFSSLWFIIQESQVMILGSFAKIIWLHSHAERQRGWRAPCLTRLLPPRLQPKAHRCAPHEQVMVMEDLPSPEGEVCGWAGAQTPLWWRLGC